jgi:peptidoglycan/xylan/chitin deacetylase (PgdA/CDA1 family)
MQELIYINFHGIGDPPKSVNPSEQRVWIAVELFEALVDFVAFHRASGCDNVQITFDDGNISDYSIALPRLIDRGLVARFFIVSDRIGREGSVGPEQLRTMRTTGMTIGTHGRRHIDWRRADDDDLRAELVDARNLIGEVIGEPVDEAAIPFGSYDRRVLGRLRESGYTRVYTSDGGRTRYGAWLISRCSVHRDDDLQSIRRLVESCPSYGERLGFAIKGFVKRWR